jgi:hypothetical protein
VAKGGKRVHVPRSDAAKYLAKAHEFITNAQVALDAARADAALLDAVHAGMAACDTVTVTVAEVRSSDSEHLRAADLLEELGRASDDADAHARQLRLLVSKKNLVEYEARRITLREARDGVERATRLVAWAEDIFSRSGR